MSRIDVIGTDGEHYPPTWAKYVSTQARSPWLTAWDGLPAWSNTAACYVYPGHMQGARRSEQYARITPPGRAQLWEIMPDGSFREVVS